MPESTQGVDVNQVTALDYESEALRSTDGEIPGDIWEK